jgi:hypothetical protein
VIHAVPGVDGAEKTARAVFTSVEEYVTASVFEYVTSQLPRDLSDLWAPPRAGVKPCSLVVIGPDVIGIGRGHGRT